MKKAFLLIAMFAISTVAIAQTTTTPPLKDRIIGKWMYKGIEEFGVLTPPDSTQKNDYVEITADGNYKMMMSGAEESGGYKLVDAYKQLYITNTTSKKTKMFTIKSSLNGKLVLDYQTPELIHHKYTYEKVN